MNIAIMQPYTFPYIGYFQLIYAVDKFIIYDDVAFIKQGWINRNLLLINNQPFLFTIPLKKPTSFTSIKNTQINLRLYAAWKETFLKTLNFNYKKAPFYDIVRQIIVDTISNTYENISKTAYTSLISVCNYLEITTKFEETSTIYKNSHLKGQDRIIDICTLENAKRYTNLMGGAKLYSKESFADRHIELSFLSPQITLYKQFNNAFVPSLSIIDILMFNSKEDIKAMIKNFKLV